jgi:predicted metal-binding protein
LITPVAIDLIKKTLHASIIQTLNGQREGFTIASAVLNGNALCAKCVNDRLNQSLITKLPAVKVITKPAEMMTLRGEVQ